MDDLVINGVKVGRGQRQTIDLPIPDLYTHTAMSMVVHVVRGRRDGARLFVSAAVHGDELLGIEIVRRLMAHKFLKRIRGTLIAVPIVNPYGVVSHSRYLPDRRDLNRSFPGRETGSLASRLAYLFMREIVANATHGIDLHTGARHRSNLPQIRADFSDPENLRLAQEFDVPVILDSRIRDGSLRAAASENGMPLLLYESGEALRYDELSIRAGVRGIISVMCELGMLPATCKPKRKRVPFLSNRSRWIRAPQSGMLYAVKPLGSEVLKGDLLARIADPYGANEQCVTAEDSGVVIGCTHLPLVHEGDALLHIASFSDTEVVADYVDSFSDYLEDEY